MTIDHWSYTQDSKTPKPHASARSFSLPLTKSAAISALPTLLP